MLATLLLLASMRAAPSPVDLAAGADHYFGADAYEDAQYLHLRADGSYEKVDVEHVMIEVRDTGRWHVDGRGVVLESDHAVRDIELGEFHVYVFDRCGQEALAGLRAKIQALRDAGQPIAADALDGLESRLNGHPLGHGPRETCAATLGYVPKVGPAGPVPAQRLDAVLAGIDAWFADAATQNLFAYRAWKYRGERFLVAMRPGTDAVQRSVDEVRQDMDEAKGERAPYVYYAISAEEFAKRAHCTYAFKFHTELNAPCNRP